MSSHEKLPPVNAAIRKATDELAQLELFVEICYRALDESTQAVKKVEIFEKSQKLLDKAEKLLGEKKGKPRCIDNQALDKAREKAAEIEAFAQKQKGDGFTYLFSLAIIRLWGILEALIDDLAIDFLSNPDVCKDKNLIYSLKGPLLEFARASAEQQTEYLCEKLKEAVNARLKQGIGRFEAILEPIGLGGNIDDAARRILFELGQVRNILIHKAGLADGRFVESCPWLNIKAGMLLKINPPDFLLYKFSAHYYLFLIRLRTIELSGCKISEKIDKIRGEFEEIVGKLWLERQEAKGEVS
jgi:hypothetical protein